MAHILVHLAKPKERVKGYKAPVKKDGDKNLKFSNCSPEIQEGLLRSREKEWDKWTEFNAGVVLNDTEVQELRNAGVSVQPMQWVETDKAAHKRREGGPNVEPILKSRLVGCGNFEDTDGIRTDSPAGDVDSHNLVFSWAASNRCKLKSADISNAYLQGKEVDRVILYRIPKGGIPGRGIAEGAIIAARVPIYGTKDAGRGFWFQLKEVVISKGYKLNKILGTMFTLRDKDGHIVSVMSSNVDDLLYASKPGYEDAMNEVLKTFSVREVNNTPFRFCGKEVNQMEDFSIKVTAKDNTEKIKPINIKKGNRLTDSITPEENTNLRSVVAALSWVARQVRPALSYSVNKLQTKQGKGTYADIKECNKVLDFALRTSEDGIYFNSDQRLDWEDAVVCTVIDASFCNENESVKGILEPGRSQQGYVVCLAQADAVNAKEMVVHPIIWSSTVIKRVCRSTMMAETFAMSRGTEAGARIRAAVVDMKGQLNMSDWEGSSANVMGHVWMTDCDSLYKHLISTKHNSVDNERLNVDLMALRQLVWERGGERQEYVDHSRGDLPRWIDTSTTVADPLTKAMNCERLSKMLDTGILDLNPTEESLIIKAKNKLLRKKARDVKKPKADGGNDPALEAPNAGNDDSNYNMNAERVNKDTEHKQSTDSYSDADYDEANVAETIETMDRALEFIEAHSVMKKLKDTELAKFKDIAKDKRQRARQMRCGRLNEFQ